MIKKVFRKLFHIIFLIFIITAPLYLIADAIRIQLMKGSTGGCGTAFFVNEYGVASTAAHVLGNASKVYMVLNNGTTYLKGTIIDKSFDKDLAFVAFPIDSRYLSIGTLQVQGTGVVLYGYPLTHKYGYGLKYAYGTAKFSYGLIRNSISYKAVIMPGNSGGPAIDKRGLVIGTVTTKLIWGDFNQGWGTTSQDLLKYAAKLNILVHFSESYGKVNKDAVVYICAI